LVDFKTVNKELITAIKHGFFNACNSGPLAKEQLMGVLFIVENIEAVDAPK
jgi:translation elongation factor EF-G